MHPAFEVIQFQSEAHPMEFLRARSFYKDACKIFTAEELTGFMNYISDNPDVGVRIPGTTGLRKMRWRAKGSGKRGGARIIYYFRDLNMPLLLLAVYPKNHVSQLSSSRMKEIERKVEFLIEELSLASFEDDRISGRRA